MEVKGELATGERPETQSRTLSRAKGMWGKKRKRGTADRLGSYQAVRGADISASWKSCGHAAVMAMRLVMHRPGNVGL